MFDFKYRYTLLFLSLIFSSLNSFSQGHKIELEAPQFKGSEVVLVEYFTNRMVPKDTVVINQHGKAIFEGEKAYDGGLYLIYFSSKHYFDLIMGDDQSFRIKTDSLDFTKKTTFTGSEDNELFYSYKNYLSEQKEKNSALVEELKDAKNEKDTAKVRAEMSELNINTQARINELIDENRGTFFSTFLEAMKEIKVPEELIVGTKHEKDSIRYNYVKNNFFMYFDLSDIRLLHTPLYETKVKTYINQVAPQHPDSLIVAVDMLMAHSGANDAMFRYMLITLFNNFADSKMMGMDKVYFHIAEKYYIPEATWSDPEFIDKLKENLEKSRYSFVNDPAPDFSLKGLPEEHFHMAQMDTAIKRDPHIGFTFNLYDIPAEYTILYFFESDCGHCKKSTPKLYEVFEKYKEQEVKVLAVHVINSVEGKEKWIDFVNEHQLYEWINCWSPYNNDFRKSYNLQSFPQLFLLDKDKTIIAKNISPEQAGDILERFLNKK